MMILGLINQVGAIVASKISWVSKRERVRGKGVFDLISCLIF